MQKACKLFVINNDYLSIAICKRGLTRASKAVPGERHRHTAEEEQRLKHHFSCRGFVNCVVDLVK